MLGTLALVLALIPLRLTWAQGDSLESVNPVSVRITVMQDGQEIRRSVEKDGEIQIIADITVSVDTVANVVAMLGPTQQRVRLSRR